ncbi:MAG: ATP-binding protein, partial [Myxococcota bacterium]
LDVIFERFERIAHNGQQGSGLGLAITRQIVEAMGGTIALQSTIGEGTRVDVRIPSGVHAPPDTTALTAYPSPADVEWLRESALLGDMQEVVRRAQTLAMRDRQLTPFSDRICAFADEFEDHKILALLSESER